MFAKTVDTTAQKFRDKYARNGRRHIERRRGSQEFPLKRGNGKEGLLLDPVDSQIQE